ncbi:hypothetical protein K501DRAFT_288222 [Backusella circina FSU 941]|nr:hypothetical protein K501DRAFT_288222 [Backusella circina FSU 941]
MSSPSEETPLLAQTSPPIKKKTTRLVYSYVFGLLFLLLVFIHNVRSTLPTPLSDAQAREQDDFSAIHCANEYLAKFTEPHCANSRENENLKEWIVKVAHEFEPEAKANGVEMEIIGNDTTLNIRRRNKFSQEEYWVVESRNVMIRLTGKSGNKYESFMINAHYDSVSTSNGVTDNGMGTAVAMELLRYFVQHPPQNTIIFLFNNFEEGGLIGADAFVHHPWFSTVKLYINLEGTGAGGRALLFRSNNLAAVHRLASSSAHLFHASPLGNDLLQAKLLKSDTDYTIFTGFDVPGLDIAFYTPRSHYHTQRDDLAHITVNSLQHMGQMALGAARGIDTAEGILATAGRPEPIVYYDILGRVMLVYSFTTLQVLNILALVLVPISSLLWIWLGNRNQGNTSELFKQRFRAFTQGCIATLVALISIGCSVGIASTVMLYLNPSVTYGGAYSIVVYLSAAAFFGLVISQFVLAKLSRSLGTKLEQDITISFYGLTALWWILLVGASVLGEQQVALGYFVIYFILSSTAATALLVCTSKTRESRFWSFAFILQMLLPVILMTEFLFLAVDSMRHTTADGTPESAIYVLLAAPIILMVLHLLPWVHAAGEMRRTSIMTLVILCVLFVVCWSTDPFNGELSPNRIVFNMAHNVPDAVSIVTLSTGAASGIQKRLKQALSPAEYETLECKKFNVYQIKCTYQTPLTPLYARQPEKEVQMMFKKDCDKRDKCQVDIITTVENSLLCRIKLSRTVEDMNVWVNNKSISTDGYFGGVVAYSAEQAKPVHWRLEYSERMVEGVEAQLGCYYDEWTQGQLPAFTTLRDNLPETDLLTIRGGVGLALVNFSPAFEL